MFCVQYTVSIFPHCKVFFMQTPPSLPLWSVFFLPRQGLCQSIAIASCLQSIVARSGPNIAILVAPSLLLSPIPTPSPTYPRLAAMTMWPLSKSCWPNLRSLVPSAPTTPPQLLSLLPLPFHHFTPIPEQALLTIKDRFSLTPLHVAASSGCIEVLRPVRP